MRKALLIICMSGLLHGSVAAQQDRGSISGIVTDPAGLVVRNATVTLEEVETSAVYRFSTNEAGRFTAPNLPIGRYKIVFEAVGFSATIRDGLTLDVAQVARVDVRLQFGRSDTSIQVTAAAPLLETETPLVGTLLDQRRVIDLPLTFSGGRYPEDFAYKLVPGVEGNNWESRINGSPAFLKEVLLDGVSATVYIGGHFGESSVSLEALDEFRIATSGFSADYGRTGGGVFNFVMKSGTNQPHGSAAGLVRNEWMNANTFSNNFYGRPRERDRRHDYAFSLGGPVSLPNLYSGKGRTFFYAAYEKYSETNRGLGSPNVTVPLLEWYEGDMSRYLTGDYLGNDALGRGIMRGALYDPSTTRVVNGRIVRDAFPGNIIPPHRISRVSRKVAEIMKKYYAPQVRQADGQFAMVNNSFFPVSSAAGFDQKQFSIKADQILSGRRRLSGTFSYVTRPRVLLDSGGVWTNSAPDGGPFSKARFQNVTTYAVRLAHDYTVRPTLLGHFSISANRQLNRSASAHIADAGGKVLGIQGIGQDSNYPEIDWGGGDRVNLASIGYTKNDAIGATSYQATSTISWSHGRHSLKFGLDGRRYYLNYRDIAGPARFQFSQEQTGLPGYPQTGSPFASFLLGEVASASVGVGTPTGAQFHSWGAFVQDDVKMTTWLTVNFGMRWDYQPVQTEKYDRLTNFTPDVVDPASGLPGGIEYAGQGVGRNGKRGFVRNRYTNFGPRIGLAWSVKSGIAFRAGYGLLYHGRAPNDWTGDPAGSVTYYGLGWGQSNKVNTPGGARAAFDWDNGYPGVLRQNTLDASAADNLGYAVSWDPDAGRVGYTQQWNANLQFELPARVVLDLGYVGSHSTGIVANQLRNILQIPTRALSLGDILGEWVDSDAAISAQARAVGAKYPYKQPGTWVPVYQLFQPYPQIPYWGTIVSYNSPLGFATYSSLQVSLNKHYSTGLTWLASYTFSKSLDNVESAFQTGSNYGRPVDYYNLSLEKSISSFDQTHVVKIGAGFELPFGKGARFGSGLRPWQDALLGGWAIRYIGNYKSSFPLGFSGTATPNANFATNRALIVNPNGEPLAVPFDSSRFDMARISTPGASANLYVNTSIIQDPPPYVRGNASYRLSQIRDFPFYNEDVGLQKNFMVGEKYRLQFRVEFLNLFNRHRLTLNGPYTAMDAASPLFGQVTGVDGALHRQTQAGIRLDF